MKQFDGGCLCGRVRFRATGTPDRVGVCHCLDCRKHHGAVFFAAAVFPRAAVTLTGDSASYDGRVFCTDCGSSVVSHIGDETEVHLGALDVPNQLKPTYELWVCRRESWLSPVDGAEQFDKNSS